MKGNKEDEIDERGGALAQQNLCCDFKKLTPNTVRSSGRQLVCQASIALSVTCHHSLVFENVIGSNCFPSS